MIACRDCHQSCLAADTEKGRLMLLDPVPAADGTYLLLTVAFGRPLAVHVNSPGRPPQPVDGAVESLYRVHVAGCPVQAAKRAAAGRRRERASGSGPGR